MTEIVFRPPKPEYRTLGPNNCAPSNSDYSDMHWKRGSFNYLQWWPWKDENGDAIHWINRIKDGGLG